jgi:hypothetical protein
VRSAFSDPLPCALRRSCRGFEVAITANPKLSRRSSASLASYLFSRYLRNRPKSRLRAEYGRMNRARQRAQSRNQRGRGSIQKFVGDAINLRIPCRRSVRPASFGEAIFASGTRSPAPHQAAMMTSGSSRASSSAEHCLPRLAQEVASGRMHQFSNPRLRCDDRLSPLFAEHAPSRKAAVWRSHVCDGRLHIKNHFRTPLARADAAGDHRDVGVDVVERARGQAEKTNPRLKNLRNRCFLVRNGSDHEVRRGGKNLAGLRTPGVGDDQSICRCAPLHALPEPRRHSTWCKPRRDPIHPRWPESLSRSVAGRHASRSARVGHLPIVGERNPRTRVPRTETRP